MQASCKVRHWSSKKEDKALTAYIASMTDVDSEIAKTTKLLIRKDCAKYNLIGTLQSVVRQKTHYKFSVNWSAYGVQIITVAMYQDYCAAMDAGIAEVDEAVRDFIENHYENERDRMRQYMEDHNLGRFYNPAQYPSKAELYDRFKVSYSVAPMPRIDGFPLDLSEHEIENLQSKMEADMKSSTDEVIKNLAGRIHQVVSHMATSLEESRVDAKGNETSKIFRDSLVENVREIADLIPKLDPTGNGTFDTYAREIKNKLCKYSADGLRKIGSVREDVAKDARSIAESLEKSFLDVESVPLEDIQLPKVKATRSFGL
jgi:hypothetical protein